MNDNQKVLIVSVGLVAFGIYIFFKKTPQLAEEKNSSGSASTPAKADWNKVLKKGSKGLEVGILQKALKTLVVDNDFGDLTQSRLKKVMNVTQTSLNDYNKFINKK
jgi:hypothetical protein